MGDFTFLKSNRIIGRNQLEIFKKYGSKAAITDFSILLGGSYSKKYFVGDSESLKDRTAYYFAAFLGKKYGCEIITDSGGFLQGSTPEIHTYGARPSFTGDATKLNLPVTNIRLEKGIQKFDCGEFPQSVVNEETANKLENEYNLHINAGFPAENFTKLTKTGKVFSFHPVYFPERNFLTYTLEEYEYEGRKFVRAETIVNYVDSFTLSDGKEVNAPSICWIEVEPITWLLDTQTNTAITEKIIFAGVPFNRARNYAGNFDNNNIGQYMKQIFINDIKPGKGVAARKNMDFESEYLSSEEQHKSDNSVPFTDRQCATDLNFNIVSDEEIIKGTIDSDISVFLHGKSSDGKSARVKQIDPDCEIVYLRNATPDSLNGKSVYNAQKGEMIDIPPTWYEKIKEKCEAEPNKIHIVFFDELTNALPSIQGMAFNIILDKEVNGIWKLPDNCRIIAAGNDMDDSLAANEMAEPLFNRFSHVYIETTVEKWLKWAAKPENNIHPAIYAYVAYKSCSKSNVLRTAYDGKKPNADPRKWEMASKVLYETQNPKMLRALIGEVLTADFVQFCKNSVITLEDVINQNYTNEDIKSMNLSEKYATAISLSKCDEKYLGIVRGFVGLLGEEILATFNLLISYRQTENQQKTTQKNINIRK